MALLMVCLKCLITLIKSQVSVAKPPPRALALGPLHGWGWRNEGGPWQRAGERTLAGPAGPHHCPDHCPALQTVPGGPRCPSILHPSLGIERYQRLQQLFTGTLSPHTGSEPRNAY